MATSRDVRDIMQLGPAPSAASSSSLLQPAPSNRRGGGPPGPPAKRLDGITRELYALMGDNQPALALAQPVKPKFKERAKAVRRSAHWSRVGFTNPARGAEAGMTAAAAADAETQARRKLVLKHWVKDLGARHVDGAPDGKFAKFNTSSQPYSYTDAEYDAWLKGESPRLDKDNPCRSLLTDSPRCSSRLVQGGHRSAVCSRATARLAIHRHGGPMGILAEPFRRRECVFAKGCTRIRAC